MEIPLLQDIERLAEVGVVLLLCAIGIEFSLKSLLRIKKSVLLGGSSPKSGPASTKYLEAFQEDPDTRRGPLT